jgi:hypothetical protein
MSDKVFSNEEYDHLLDMGSEYVKKLYGEIEQKLISQGYDLNSNPAIALLFKDPVNALKRMHRNPKEFADWAVKGR